MGWKTKLIITNLKSSKLSNLINVIALSFAVIIGALFGAFYFSQQDMIKNQSKLFPEYLTSNIEKSEEIEHESSFLKLKQVSRPSINEVNSLLAFNIDAEVRLNYTNLFLQDQLRAYEQKLMPVLPIFLYDFTFDETQKKMLDTRQTAEDTTNSVYVNQAFIDELKNYINFVDYSEVKLKYTLSVMLDNETYEFLFEFNIRGVFFELEYLSTPKLFLSQVAFDTYFQSTYLSDDISIYDYILALPPTDVLSSYSYRLYFSRLDDVHKALEVVDSLKDEKSYLNIVSEHLSRIQSLKDILNFTNIVLLISIVLIVISLLFINVTITHLEIKKANAKIALLYYFGAKTSEIIDIYLGQNLLIVSLSMFTLLIVPKIAQFINLFLYDFLGIRAQIEVPLLLFLDVPFLFPFLIFTVIYGGASVISIINILIKRQKSLIKRLAHND